MAKRCVGSMMQPKPHCSVCCSLRPFLLINDARCSVWPRCWTPFGSFSIYKTCNKRSLRSAHQIRKRTSLSHSSRFACNSVSRSLVLQMSRRSSTQGSRKLSFKASLLRSRPTSLSKRQALIFHHALAPSLAPLLITLPSTPCGSTIVACSLDGRAGGKSQTTRSE